jgi:hypothetical protein
MSFFFERQTHRPKGTKTKDTVMKTKAIATLVAGSFLLLGCANSGHYPITGDAIGPNDQVRYMVAPAVTPN